MARHAPFDRGAWRIERQRCQLPDERPPPPERGKWLADLMPGVVKRLKLEGDLWRNRIAEAWPRVVGPQVAAHSRPGRIEHGMLTVYVVHSVWLQELRRSVPRMLANLKREFPDAPVQRMRLALDPDAEAAGLSGPPGRSRRGWDPRGGTGGATC